MTTKKTIRRTTKTVSRIEETTARNKPAPLPPMVQMFIGDNGGQLDAFIPHSLLPEVLRFFSKLAGRIDVAPGEASF